MKYEDPTPHHAAIKPGWLRAAIFMVVFFGCAVLAGWAVSFVTNPTSGPLKGLSALNSTIISLFVISIIAIVLTAIFCRFIDRRPVNSLGLTWPHFQYHAVTGFCLGIALLGTGSLILFFTKNLQWTNAALNADDLFIAAVLMLMIAISEEIVFRG